MTFAAPNGGVLVPGVYDNAARAAFHPPDQPGLEVSGDGRGSNTLTGSFDVKQAVYDASGNVLSFDATFVQHSEGAAPALTGEIKYNASGGSYTVSGNHTYADDGVYKITSILADNAPGTASATATATANIVSAIALTPAASTLNVTEGATASTVVALITNPVTAEPASDYQATIRWGDGATSAGTITGAAGAYTVSGSHAYADEGNYKVFVTAKETTDPTTYPATVTLAAQVADGDQLVGAAAPITATEGSIFTGAVLATFADAGYPNNDPTDFTATVDWGDGTTVIGNVSTAGDGTFTVSSNHIYADEGVYPVKATLMEDATGSASAMAAATATVVEGDAISAGPSVTASAIPGTAFSGTVATFVNSGDPTNVPADFNSTIDWGDGTTSAGTVSASAVTSLDMISQPGDYIGGSATYHYTPVTGSLGVTSHSASDSQITFIYQESNLGHWWFVTFAAPNGATLVPGFYDNAARAAFHPPSQPGLEVSGDGRGSNTLTGSFTITQAVYDASGNVLRFDATFVQHSEGAVPALTGEIKFNALTGTFTVSGSHTYADKGAYAVTTTLAEDAPGTASATATATANVAEVVALSAPNSPLAATEGTTASAVVAYITDPGLTHSASDFQATIDWGDGATTTGAVSGAAGSFTVTGSHAYADEGDFTVTVATQVTGVPTVPPAATLAAHVADGDVLAGTAAPITATEAIAFNGTVATFSDSGYPNHSLTDFTATIDWGDGATTTGSMTRVGSGPFTVSGAHVYAKEGSYPVKITLVEDASGTASATVTALATVTDGDVLTPGASITASATERNAFSGTVATFNDSGNASNLPEDFMATIDWGDGATTAGSVTRAGSGPFTVYGQHTYADEGAFNVTVTLSDAAPGTASATATATVNVADALGLSPTHSPLVATEGTTASAVVAFLNGLSTTDAASDFLTTIDWGDGVTTAGTVSGAAGSFTVSGSHAYADEGNFTVTVTAQESGVANASTATATFEIHVADGDVLVGTAAPIAAVKGKVFTGAALATFSDVGYPDHNPADFTTSINWGDGTTDVGNVSTAGDGSFTVSGNHTYADPGSYEFQVTLVENAPGSASAMATASATVAGGDVLTPGPSITASVTEGTAFSGTLATFADSGNPNSAPGDFTATIHWGDGATSTGTISGSAGAFTVSGSHRYAEEGEMIPSVVINENAAGGAHATATAVVHVDDAPLSLSGATLSAAAGSDVKNLTINFTDANPNGEASDYTAVIDWGDGSTTAGAVSANGNAGFQVIGTHVYSQPAAHGVQVVIQDQGGSQLAETLGGAALQAAPGATLGEVAVASFSYGDGSAPGSSFAAMIDWGDGSTSAGSVTASGGQYQVTGMHAYAKPGDYAMVASVEVASVTVASNRLRLVRPGAY